MQSFIGPLVRDHLNKELQDPRFKELYEEEKYLLEFGLQIAQARKKLGMTQKELAEKSHVTQQQLSKIENGTNCNLLTFVKISSTLGFTITISA